MACGEAQCGQIAKLSFGLGPAKLWLIVHPKVGQKRWAAQKSYGQMELESGTAIDTCDECAAARPRGAPE